MTKSFLPFLISLCLLFSLNYQPSYAQTTSPIASPSALTPQTDVSDQINGEIDIIRQVVKDKVKQKIDSIIGTDNRKYAWFGQITSIEGLQLNITDVNNQTLLITIDPSATVINSSKRTVTTKDLKVDQTILAMGYVEDSLPLAKRILIVNTPLSSLRTTVVSGTISDISQTNPIISLVTNNRQVFQIKSDKNTKSLVKNQKIIAVLRPDNKDNQTWTLVYTHDLSSPTPTPTPEE